MTNNIPIGNNKGPIYVVSASIDNSGSYGGTYYWNSYSPISYVKIPKLLKSPKPYKVFLEGRLLNIGILGHGDCCFLNNDLYIKAGPVLLTHNEAGTLALEYKDRMEYYAAKVTVTEIDINLLSVVKK